MTKAEIKQLEDLDLSLLRNFLNTPCTVPAEAVYLEVGCQNIETIIKGTRFKYDIQSIYNTMEISSCQKLMDRAGKN